MVRLGGRVSANYDLPFEEIGEPEKQADERIPTEEGHRAQNDADDGMNRPRGRRVGAGIEQTSDAQDDGHDSQHETDSRQKSKEPTIIGGQSPRIPVGDEKR